MALPFCGECPYIHVLAGGIRLNKNRDLQILPFLVQSIFKSRLWLLPYSHVWSAGTLVCVIADALLSTSVSQTPVPGLIFTSHFILLTPTHLLTFLTLLTCHVSSPPWIWRTSRLTFSLALFYSQGAWSRKCLALSALDLKGCKGMNDWYVPCVSLMVPRDKVYDMFIYIPYVVQQVPCAHRCLTNKWIDLCLLAFLECRQLWVCCNLSKSYNDGLWIVDYLTLVTDAV